MYLDTVTFPARTFFAPPLAFRLLAVGALAVVGLALAGTASAKLTRVSVVEPASAPTAGTAWTITARIAVRGKPYAKAGYRPTLYVVDKSGSTVATFRGTPVAPGRFHISIVFPRAGSWRYDIVDPVTGDWFFPVPHVGP